MINSLHTYVPHPILTAIGSVSIHWYGLLLAAAIILGFGLLGKLAKRRQLPVEAIQSLYVNLVIWGFVGARLYHVLNEWGYYWRNPAEIIMVWHGGLAIHGALIAGVIVVWYFSRKHKIGFYQLADIFSLPLILGQGIVRWGNYFNQELFGRPTNLPWGIPIDAAHRPVGFEQFGFFHPTFLYESVWNLAVFCFLLWLFLKKSPLASQNSLLSKEGEGGGYGGVRESVGVVFWAYIGLYSLGRVGTELLRIDSVPLIWGVRLPLLASAILVILAAVMLWRVIKRP